MKPALSNDLKTLTSLRFFAAFWVFLFHLRSRIAYEEGPIWNIIENGARGVDFFFILSGFIIFHVYEADMVSGKFSLSNFTIKRFARIYPLHLVMTLVFLVLSLLQNEDIEGLFASLALLHAWNLTDGLVLNGPSWTLSAEFFAYLLFGIVFFRSPSTWIIVIAFIVFSISVHLVAVALGKTAFVHLTWDYGALRILPLFLLGMLLKRLVPHVSTPFASVLGLAGLAGFFVTASVDDVGYLIIFPFALLIISGARLSEQRNLPTNSRTAVYLGEISYSIYMIHISIIVFWFDVLPRIGLGSLPWILICPLVLLCSAISYHVIEVPCRRWINRLFCSPRPERPENA